MKKCRKCGEWKDDGEFYRSTNRLGKVTVGCWCKSCYSSYYRARYMGTDAQIGERRLIRGKWYEKVSQRGWRIVWTDADSRKVDELRRLGMSWVKIARAMGVSVYFLSCRRDH